MMLRFRALGLATFVALAIVMSPQAVAPVSAWGAVGHRVVARIAWALMTPTARSQATALLEVQPDLIPKAGQDAFVAAGTWADEVRSTRPESYNWHFVDIPVDQPSYDAKRDCPPTEKGDCVIAEIARAQVELVESGRSIPLKGEALKFLIHFVGDLHQPLHSVDNHDRGGND